VPPGLTATGHLLPLDSIERLLLTDKLIPMRYIYIYIYRERERERESIRERERERETLVSCGGELLTIKEP